MMLATRSRRKRAAIVKFAMAASAALLLFTPRLDAGTLPLMASFLPLPASERTGQ